MFTDAATAAVLPNPDYAEVESHDRPVPLLSVAKADPRVLAIAERCKPYLELPENWNSYRSRPIDARLLAEGLQVLALLLRPGTRAPDLVPTARGGVQLEWHAANEDLEIEVVALGQYRVFHSRNGYEDEFTALDDLSRIVPLVHSIQG